MAKGRIHTPEETFRQKLLEKLPPIIARKEVEKYLGGAVAQKTLANADSLGEGPVGAYVIGRNVVYPTAALVDWIIARLGFSPLHNNINNP